MRSFSGVNLDHIMAEINHDINLLYVIPCAYTRNIVLNHLRDRIAMIESAAKAIEQTTFTLEELSRFDGKNGNPAYVAVYGTVYDVTNNAAWAAATHFGLTAGRDLTRELASCHAGRPILSKLRAVGKLV